MKKEKWTDEELIQVYDLQKRYTEKVIDFVRKGDDGDVYKFMQLIPDLNEGYLHHEQDIFSKNEFISEYGGENVPQGRYVYKDMFDKWQGADILREIFEEKYQWSFAEAHPASLALFAGDKEVALESYSAERYEKMRKEIPYRLMIRVQDLIFEYPKEIQDKAFRKAIYGYTNGISNGALLSYQRKHMPEFEKLESIVERESANTIVAAYDLQFGITIYNPELRDNYLTSAMRDYAGDGEIFRLVYGDKSAELLKQADENTIRLARQYDFVHSSEKLAVLENHKICLFGTAEEKLKIPYKNDPFCVSDKDYQVILEAVASKYERERFSRKYQASKSGNKEYDNQPYKVVTRVKTDIEQPQWLIVFGDGKIITAKADEVISSAINERLYGEQVENFGTRALSEASISVGKEKMTLVEGEKRISAIIRQLSSNGENSDKLKDFLEEERRNLSKSNVR